MSKFPLVCGTLINPLSFILSFLLSQRSKHMITRPQTSAMFVAYFQLYMVLIGSSCTTLFALTNDTDKEALLEFKSQITLDPFNALESWNDSVEVCNWHGIVCSHRHERVTVLNLTLLGLSGSLSPAIANLTFLRDISLDGNNLHGRIPQEIGRLFRLQSLSLQNNSFQGQLPTDIANCSRLKVLDLGRNNLSGPIPSNLGKLSNLKILSMPYNSFSGPIPVSLCNLSALQTLSLLANMLHGIIPNEIERLSNLEYLELSSNMLSGSFFPLVHNVSSIEYLSLSYNLLSGPISPSLGYRLQKLRIFRIQDNRFSGRIPVSITNASKLEQVDMSFNAFSGPVPSSFEKLPNLLLLDMGGNQLIGKLENLILNLSTKLNSLRLDMNRISGGIPKGIQQLVNLQLLALNDNMITGSIPGSIGNLATLVELDVSNNILYGHVPSSIGNITGLSKLSMSGNMLEGDIPVSLGNCEKLQSLDLSDNHLTGNIPDQLYKITSLSLVLDLSRNQLSGQLPTRVDDLENLGAMDLSNNNLTGVLPQSFGGLVVLEHLYMQGNHFEGEIPESLGYLMGIIVMDLSRNSFSGQIPKGFSSLRIIQYLNLSFNRLEGQVPNEGIFRNSSAFSIFENRGLCGGPKLLQLPSCPKQDAEKNGKAKHITHYKVLIFSIGGGSFLLIYLLYSLSIYIWTQTTETSAFEISNSQILRISRNSESPLGNQYPKVTYGELLRCTEGFSQANMVGKGRYGSVYKGTLSFSDHPVAVKVIDLQQRGANKSFVAECEALKNVRHRNLIKTITACSGIDFQGRDFKALVYELMPNGSLESWLHPYPTMLSQESRCLSLAQRLDIAIDVASAMHYLHNSCETPIIHRDLKPGNILLDEELHAHVSDFGLARFLMATTERRKRVRSNGIPGTIGYIALEYGVGGATSTLVDVYSYGILLLEMFTGKRPTDDMFKDNHNLRNYVRTSLPDGVLTIVDPLIKLEIHNMPYRTHNTNRGRVEECLASIFRVGVICSSQSPGDRRDAADVLMQLNAIKKHYLEHIVS